MHWPPDVLFANRGELEIARVRFTIDGTRFHTSVWAVAGNIFSLVTRPSIKAKAFGQPEDLTVKVLSDPEAAAASPVDVARLPRRYLDFCRADPPPATHGWNVAPPHEAHIVHLPDSDYVVLAEYLGERFILASATGGDPELYVYELGETPSAAGTDFGALLRD